MVPNDVIQWLANCYQHGVLDSFRMSVPGVGRVRVRGLGIKELWDPKDTTGTEGLLKIAGKQVLNTIMMATTIDHSTAASLAASLLCQNDEHVTA